MKNTTQNYNKVETMIVKHNGTEFVNADLQFRILTNGSRHDMFIYKTYAEAKSRLLNLSKLFKHSTHEILVIESN